MVLLQQHYGFSCFFTKEEKRYIRKKEQPITCACDEHLRET